MAVSSSFMFFSVALLGEFSWPANAVLPAPRTNLHKDPHARSATKWLDYYNSTECQQYITRDINSSNPLYCKKSAPIVYSAKYNFGYMKTPKAGSTAFEAHLQTVFDDAEFVPRSKLPEKAFIFTFVRRPILQIKAGYAAVGLAVEDHAGEKVNSTFQMIHRSLDAGNARYQKFLHELSQGNFGPQDDPYATHHASTQASGVICGPGLQFVGHLENLDADWQHVQKLAALPADVWTETVPVAHDRDKEVHPLYAVDEVMPFTKETMKQVCPIYAADFACFGYKVPEPCVNTHQGGDAFGF